MLRSLAVIVLIVVSAAAAVVALDTYLQRSFTVGHDRIAVGDGVHEVVRAMATAREEQGLLPGISGGSEFPGPFCLVDDLPKEALAWQAYPVRGVEVQQVEDGFRVRLTRQDRSCPEGRCWQPAGDFDVTGGGRGWLDEHGCALFAGGLVRVESRARLFPPLTHDYFLVRFDSLGEVAWRSRIYGMGESAYLDEPWPDSVARSRDDRIYRMLAEQLGEGDRPVVVASSTLAGSELPLVPGVERLDPDLLSGLRGAPPATVPVELDHSEAVVLYDSDEDFRDTQGWERFHRRFPWAGGFYRFSPVTWGDDGTHALVYAIGWRAIVYDPPEWDLGPVHDDRMGYYQFDLEQPGDAPVFVSSVVEEREVQDPERASYRPPSDIERLAPSDFTDLPPDVASALERRRCRIPQAWGDDDPHNVVSGFFAREGQTDWAALCSVDEASNVVVMWGGPARCPSPIEDPVADSLYLVRSGMDGLVFSRGLASVGIDLRYWEPLDDPDEGPLDHDAISDAFYEKGATAYYCRDGSWLRFVSG